MPPRRRTSTRQSLLAILGLGCALGAALPDVPSRQNFLRRTWAKATVLGNYVYIDGGELTQLVDGKLLSEDSNVVNSTLSIDMSKSWKSTDVVIRTIPKPGPAKANVVLWTDTEAGAFYSWGGKFPGGRNVTKPALWKFTADGEGGGIWSQEDPGNPTRFNDLHPTEDGAFANTNSTGFVIGGVAHAYSEPNHPTADAIPGMVSFDMKTKMWQNGTANFSPFNDGVLVQASAQYIPAFGPDGLIMTLGGYVPPVPSKVNDDLGPGLDLRNLTFFNPQTKRTYWQIATGTIPSTPRARACTTIFQTADGGSDIFLFGGTNGATGSHYQDAYILSLPGFVWTKLPDPPGGPRTAATCVRVGKRQVLSIGGDGGSGKDADPAPQGLLLFDMTSMEWKDSYDASAAEYERAKSIQDWYSSGSLDNVKWSSDEVQKLFAVAAITSSTGNLPAPTGNPITNSTTDDGSGSAPVGAIVGGVVGGIGGLAIIAVVVWIVFVKRRKQRAPVPGTDPDGHVPGTPLPGYSNTPETKNTVTDVPEVPGSHGYNELPARDAASTYPFHGPAELGQQARAVELDATPRW